MTTSTVEYAYTEEEWQQRLAGQLVSRARRQRIQAATRGILDRRRKAGLRARHAAKLSACGRKAAAMSADFSRLLAHLDEGLQSHADRDGLPGVRRAVFLARGGHAPGTVCPSEPPEEPTHIYWCAWPDDECVCPPDHWRRYH